ncbi:MAG: protein rep [Roseburia sp.]|nr:protein rep [Roseburia sp.]
MGNKMKKQPELVPVFEAPPSIEITSDEVDKLDHNTTFNDVYAEYYSQLADELDDEQYKKNAERMLNCHKRWCGEYYDMQEVFDVQQIFLCHDRLCVNCQHLRQAAQLQRFTKIFEDVVKDHDLYMMTLTVPNCPIDSLRDSLDRLSSAFQSVIRYFTGNSKVAGIDFASYGFYACYRNIEIVLNPDSFHPHYHCILALKKDLAEDKLFTNDYSFSRGIFTRKFSDLEILIQKILALKYNRIRLDKIIVDYVLNGIAVNQNKLEKWCGKYNVSMHMLNSFRRQGYSCVIDKIEGQSWHEAFKYVTKLTKNGSPMMYYQFKVLVPLIKNMHFGQGYGAWYKLPKDEWEIDSDILAAYEYVIRRLKEVEDPVGFTFKLLELKERLHNKSLKCISRKKAYKYVQEYLAARVPDEDTPISSDDAKEPGPVKKFIQLRLDLSLQSDDDDDLPF